MSNKRVYTVAKEMGMASKDLMAVLEQAKIPVKSHMSTLTEDQQKQLFSFIRQAQDAQGGGVSKPSDEERKAEDNKPKQTDAKKVETEEVRSTGDTEGDKAVEKPKVKKSPFASSRASRSLRFWLLDFFFGALRFSKS